MCVRSSRLVAFCALFYGNEKVGLSRVGRRSMMTKEAVLMRMTHGGSECIHRPLRESFGGVFPKYTALDLRMHDSSFCPNRPVDVFVARSSDAVIGTPALIFLVVRSSFLICCGAAISSDYCQRSGIRTLSFTRPLFSSVCICVRVCVYGDHRVLDVI